MCLKPAQRHVLKQADEDRVDDHFVERDGVRFAGTHLLLDLWGVSRGLDDAAFIVAALKAAAIACGATVLQSFAHEFSPYGGVTAVVVLAESHISIHSWPERGYAAIDVFMCGTADPSRSIEVLREHFRPQTLNVVEQLRGEESAAGSRR